jgi:hypothetical protein
MSEETIHAASRRAATALKDYTEADVVWTEERVIALMFSGVSFVEAVSKAAEECSGRIVERKVAALAEVVKQGPTPVRGEPGRRGPTLKASLGDMLAARGGRL